MGEFLKQFGLLVLDYLIGFFVTMMADMRHSIRYRAQERQRKRSGIQEEEELKILDFNDKKYKVVCSCNDLIILKEIEEIVLPPIREYESITTKEETTNQ